MISQKRIRKSHTQAEKMKHSSKSDFAIETGQLIQPMYNKAPASRLQKQLIWPMRAQVGHTSLLAETGYSAQWPRTCLGPKQLPHHRRPSPRPTRLGLYRHI